jgi:hypothetical protein
MAEEIAEVCRLGQLEDFHPGLAVILENDHTRAAMTGFSRSHVLRPRWPFEIVA